MRMLWGKKILHRSESPEWPIVGKVRYMTSESTARKYDVDPYLARWSGGTG